MAKTFSLFCCISGYKKPKDFVVNAIYIVLICDIACCLFRMYDFHKVPLKWFNFDSGKIPIPEYLAITEIVLELILSNALIISCYELEKKSINAKKLIGLSCFLINSIVLLANCTILFFIPYLWMQMHHLVSKKLIPYLISSFFQQFFYTVFIGWICYLSLMIFRASRFMEQQSESQALRVQPKRQIPSSSNSNLHSSSQTQNLVILSSQNIN